MKSFKLILLAVLATFGLAALASTTEAFLIPFPGETPQDMTLAAARCPWALDPDGDGLVSASQLIWDPFKNEILRVDKLSAASKESLGNTLVDASSTMNVRPSDWVTWFGSRSEQDGNQLQSLIRVDEMLQAARPDSPRYSEFKTAYLASLKKNGSDFSVDPTFVVPLDLRSDSVREYLLTIRFRQELYAMAYRHETCTTERLDKVEEQAKTTISQMSQCKVKPRYFLPGLGNFPIWCDGPGAQALFGNVAPQKTGLISHMSGIADGITKRFGSPNTKDN